MIATRLLKQLLGNTIIYAVGFILAFAGQSPLAWALGGTESMDRPSAKILPEPVYPSDKPEQSFELPKLPESARTDKANDRQLFIKHIRLQGNQAVSTEQLTPLLQPYLNRKVFLYEIEDLRQKLSRYYVDKGYINSGAIIKADAYRNGELQINLIEGRLDEIRVKGLDGLRAGYVINRLNRDDEAAFNVLELQENFQLLLKDPLISRMNGRILPGERLGQSILAVDVTRAKPYQLSFFGNNQRPPSIGGEAFGLTGQVWNLTGWGDSVDFTFINSEGSQRYAGGFSLPISDSGTQFFFHFDEGDSVIVEAPINELDIQSQVHSLEGGVSYPFIRRLKTNLTAGVSLAARENETFLSGVPSSFVPGEPTGRNQATVWRIFHDFLHYWDNHALALRSSFSVGMDAFGATKERRVSKQLQVITPEFPDSEFFAWLGQAQYAWRFLDNGSQFLLRSNIQLSDEPLLPLEQIAIGGMHTVRGYRENQLVRDQGFSVSAEFRMPLLDTGRQQLQLIPFMDYGEAWNHVPQSGEQGGNALHSVGIGFEWRYQPVLVEFYYGHALLTPQNKQSKDIQDDGIHFQARWDVF